MKPSLDKAGPMKSTAVRLPARLIAVLDRESVAVRRTRSELVRFAVEEFLYARGKLRPAERGAKSTG